MYSFSEFQKREDIKNLSIQEQHRKYFYYCSDKMFEKSVSVNSSSSTSSAGGRRIQQQQQSMSCSFPFNGTMDETLAFFGVNPGIASILPQDVNTQTTTFSIDEAGNGIEVSVPNLTLSESVITFPIANGSITFESEIEVSPINITGDFGGVFAFLDPDTFNQIMIFIISSADGIGGTQYQLIFNAFGNNYLTPTIYTNKIRIGIVINSNKTGTFIYENNKIDFNIPSDRLIPYTRFTNSSIDPSEFCKTGTIKVITSGSDMLLSYPDGSKDPCGNLTKYSYIIPEFAYNFNFWVPPGEDPDSYGPFTTINGNTLTYGATTSGIVKMAKSYSPISTSSIPNIYGVEVTNNSTSGIIFCIGIFNGVDIYQSPRLIYSFISGYWLLQVMSQPDFALPLYTNPQSTVGMYVHQSGCFGVVIDGTDLGWFDESLYNFTYTMPSPGSLVSGMLDVMICYFPDSGQDPIEINVVDITNGYPAGTTN